MVSAEEMKQLVMEVLQLMIQMFVLSGYQSTKDVRFCLDGLNQKHGRDRGCGLTGAAAMERDS